jgi:hypothetical protein
MTETVRNWMRCETRDMLAQLSLGRFAKMNLELVAALGNFGAATR